MSIQQFSPNMLKTFELCPRKFHFKYVKNINMPINDDIFEFGKNIHALASYYLKKENIDKMEKSLTEKEYSVWNYLKTSKYFSYEVIATEYNLAFKLGGYFYGGRLDALVKNGDEYYILDYKTGLAPQNAKFDYQTIIYILAVMAFYKTNNITFVYLDLKNREDVCIEYNQNMQDIYESRLLDIVSRINSYDKIAPKKECKCEYSKICY